MSDKRRSTEIRDVTRFALSWCRGRNLPRELVGDLVQEAHLAALLEGRDRRRLVRAMDRLRKREFRADRPLSALGIDVA